MEGHLGVRMQLREQFLKEEVERVEALPAVEVEVVDGMEVGVVVPMG
jgi:hypothetical protein